MNTPVELQHALSRPSMFVPAVEFDVLAAFILGFDAASNGGAVVGLREWLVVQVGGCDNLAWTELVLRLAFPDAESPRQKLLDQANQQQAVERLVALLNAFWEKRGSHTGLEQIYFEYHQWLKTQSWYKPGFPGWMGETTIR